MKQRCVAPVGEEGGVVTLAMADPGDAATIEAVELATGMHVRPVKGAREDILRLLDEGESKAASFDDIITAISRYELDTSGEDDVDHLRDIASEVPIVRLVDFIISMAIEKRASDIHVEPQEKELRVRFRVDDIMHDVKSLPRNIRSAFISRVKIMAGLDIAERRLPQDGRIKRTVGGREIDFRVATIPTMFGESLVLRILDRSSLVLKLEEIGFSPQNRAVYERMITRPHGIILVTGPTGSGKTTTLYTTLEKLNSPDKKIITIEDPVEYNLAGINQIQVQPQIGLTFANGLRHIVRQDPNIIMVGEIRDRETAEIAVQSALTGHFVFSTLHTNDAPGAVVRLLEMGIEDYLLASSLICVVAQRLVRVICARCKESFTPTGADLKLIVSHCVPGVVPAIYRGWGCEECDQTGYRGRRAIFEVLPVDRAIRELILSKPEAEAIRERASSSGMVSLRDDGFAKVFSGVTTLEEIIRTTSEE